MTEDVVSYPTGWAACRLGDLISLNYGKALPAKTRDATGDVPVFGSNGIVGVHCQALIDGPAIIVGRKGSAGEVEFSKEASWPIDTTYFVHPPSGLETRFTYFLLKSLGLDRLDRSTAVPGLNRDDAYALNVGLPPEKEQRRIVDKIETLFARLDKGEEALRDVQKLLARYRQSVLKSAVTGQLTADWRTDRKGELEHGSDLLNRILEAREEQWDGRGNYKKPEPPNADSSPDLPDGWEWATVDQVTSHFGNGLSKKPVLKENDFPILRISATRVMTVSVDDLRYYDPAENENLDRFWVQRGDLLFTRYNGSAHLVGVCGQMREEQPVLHPDKLIKARPVNLVDLSADFLEVAWNCGATREHIEKHIKTTAGQQGIAGSDVKTAPFPLPSGPEQIEIAARVLMAFDKTETLSNWCDTELKRSASLRQSILKDSFAGRLVPQDPNDEPAAALLARIREARATAPRLPRKFRVST